MNNIHIPILYEDSDIVVVNKPPGVVANEAETHSAPTLQAWMDEYLRASDTKTTTDWQALIPAEFSSEFGTPEEIFRDRRGIVHRLDKDTSGVIVLAKNPGSLVALLRQFKQRQVEKKYTALVHGKIQAPRATLSFPIGRSSQDRTQFAVKPEGRLSETAYQVIQKYSQLDFEKVGETLLSRWIEKHPDEKVLSMTQLNKRLSIYQGFTLVECWPKTGRTHQIRVHMSHIKHPLVGDGTYVGKKRKNLDPLWCPRQFLHATQLTIAHPRTTQPITFTAPLWPDIDLVLSYLHAD